MSKWIKPLKYEAENLLRIFSVFMSTFLLFWGLIYRKYGKG